MGKSRTKTAMKERRCRWWPDHDLAIEVMTNDNTTRRKAIKTRFVLQCKDGWWMEIYPGCEFDPRRESIAGSQHQVLTKTHCWKWARDCRILFLRVHPKDTCTLITICVWVVVKISHVFHMSFTCLSHVFHVFEQVSFTCLSRLTNTCNLRLCMYSGGWW